MSNPRSTTDYSPVPSQDPNDNTETRILNSDSSEDTTCLSRASLVLSIPHLIAFTALLVLSIYVALKVRAEAARQLKTEDLARRCAFVYLVTPNQSNVDNLGFSLQSLNKYVNPGARYKILIIHQDVPPVVQGRLQALSEAPLHFREYHFDAALQLNDSMGTAAHTNSTIQRIQHTNFFWFYAAILAEPSQLGPLSDVDYIVRLDVDSAFTGEVNRDFIRDFVLSGAQYGYIGRGKDCGENSTYGLRELALSYVEINGLRPRSMELWAPISRAKSGECLPTYENHLEVLNLQFFRSHSGVQDWIRVVNADGGIYKHEWTDAALRYITVALYAAPEKLVKYGPDAIPYSFPHKMDG